MKYEVMVLKLLGPKDVVERVIRALRKVYDPEIPINVFDLGLIYRVEVKGSRIEIDYTLTAPFCPVAPLIHEQIVEAVRSEIPEVEEIDVNLVLDPPWNPTMMTEKGREEFKALFGFDLVERWMAKQAG